MTRKATLGMTQRPRILTDIHKYQTFPFSLRVDKKLTSANVCLWLYLFVSNMKAQFTMSPYVVMNAKPFFRLIMLDFQRIGVFSGLSDRNVGRVNGQRR